MNPHEIEGRRDAALDMVRALCKPRRSEGARSWIMSIPARPDYNPDLVIAASIRDVTTLLDELAAVTRERDALEAVLERISKAYPQIGPEGMMKLASETLTKLESGELRKPDQKHGS